MCGLSISLSDRLFEPILILMPVSRLNGMDEILHVSRKNLVENNISLKNAKIRM